MNKLPQPKSKTDTSTTPTREQAACWGAAVLVLLVLAAGIGWASRRTPVDASAVALVQNNQVGVISQSVARPAGASSSSGGHQTELPAMPDSFLTEHLQQTFEDMLLEVTAAGEVRDVAVLRQRLNALVGKYFPSELVQRATALLARYVDYRQALGQLAAPTDPGDPSAMRASLLARQRVRQQYFSAEEYEALFGQDERLDRYTLARLGIERQTQLSSEQKYAALNIAAQVLSDSQRAQRSAAVQHLDVQAQTAAFDSHNTSTEERHAQRSAQYGHDAALSLSELDGQERQWQTSLDRYAQATEALPTNASAEQRQQLEQLRQQLFTPEQRLRIDAGLELRALSREPSKN